MTADRETMLLALAEALAGYVQPIFGVHGCAKEYAGQFRVAAEHAFTAIEPLIAEREEAARREEREAVLEIVRNNLPISLTAEHIIATIRARGGEREAITERELLQILSIRARGEPERR